VAERRVVITEDVSTFGAAAAPSTTSQADSPVRAGRSGHFVYHGGASRRLVSRGLPIELARWSVHALWRLRSSPAVRSTRPRSR
jgi:hypothetical protein